MSGNSQANVVANHHADYPGFSGVEGALAGMSMMIGRAAGNRLAAELVELSAGDTLVDIGCGPGSATRLAARRGATVIGVDPAPVMLRLAGAIPARGDLTWRVGTAEALPCEPDGATVVWALATVHHWRDIDAALVQIRRVLAPGGRFLAMERSAALGATGHASHGWTAEQAEAFASDCRRAGLIDVSVSQQHRGRRSLVVVVAREPDHDEHRS